MKNVDTGDRFPPSFDSNASPSSRQNLVEVDEMLKDLIPDFMARRFQEFELMEDLASRRDYEALANYGHKLKGSSLNYGFRYLGGLASQLELAAHSQNLDLVHQLVQEIQNHVRQVRIVYVEES